MKNLWTVWISRKICNGKSKISVWSYKSWASLWESLSSVSSNLHRFKWAFAQLIFSGVEYCWLILHEIQTIQRIFILSSKLKLKMKSFLGSLSCIFNCLYFCFVFWFLIFFFLIFYIFQGKAKVKISPSISTLLRQYILLPHQNLTEST